MAAARRADGQRRINDFVATIFTPCKQNCWNSASADQSLLQHPLSAATPL